MHTRQAVRLRRQLEAQMEREREATARGAPLEEIIDPETAARMTKPRAPVILWQVVVEQRGGLPIAVGPAAPEHIAGRLAETIKVMIRAGKEATWFNPIVMPVAAGQRQPMNGLAH